MNRFFLNLSLSLVAFCAVLISCNNEPAFGEHNENQVEKYELLQTAQNLVQSRNGTVPLPINNGGESLSRSAMSLITEGTPLWDYVKYYNIDGVQVLMIELQTAEKVFSRITFTKDGITTTKESTTFSRLVIRKKENKVYAHVLTYMPDEDYATANKEKLDTIGYYPKYVDFTGITLTSNLDGSVFRGIRYDNGHVAGIISKHEHSECNHNHESCSHSHESEYTRHININLFTQSSQQPQSRADYDRCINCSGTIINGKCQGCGWGYGAECPSCKMETLVDGMCMNCSYLEYLHCKVCKKQYTECICNEKKCSICGEVKCSCPNFDIDTNDICPYCKRLIELCTCEKPVGGGNSSGDGSGSKPTQPSTNENDPILYSNVINSDATFATNDMSLMMKSQDGLASLTAIMTFIDNVLYAGQKESNYFDSYYASEFNGSSINEGIKYSDTQSFINIFFNTVPFDTFQFAINNRYVVVSSFPGSSTTFPHYVLIVGIESDRDVVYLDPLDGEAYLLCETRFNDSQKIVITGPVQN